MNITNDKYCPCNGFVHYNNTVDNNEQWSSYNKTKLSIIASQQLYFDSFRFDRKQRCELLLRMSFLILWKVCPVFRSITIIMSSECNRIIDNDNLFRSITTIMSSECNRISDNDNHIGIVYLTILNFSQYELNYWQYFWYSCKIWIHSKDSSYYHGFYQLI